MNFYTFETPNFLKEIAKKIMDENYYHSEKIIFRKQISSKEFSNFYKKIYQEYGFDWNDEKIEYMELCVWQNEIPRQKVKHDFEIHRDLIKNKKKICHVNTLIIYLENSFTDHKNG